jgi:hypothetical protein
MDIEFKTWGLSLDFYSQWEVLRGRTWNWIDFTVLHLGFEHSPYKASNEVQVGILGLNLTITVWKRIKTDKIEEPPAWRRIKDPGEP